MAGRIVDGHVGFQRIMVVDAQPGASYEADDEQLKFGKAKEADEQSSYQRSSARARSKE